MTKPTHLTGAIRALKGTFGFIAGDDGTDYFFHWSAMHPDGKNFRDLILQERVEFEIFSGERGVRAVSVRVRESNGLHVEASD